MLACSVCFYGAPEDPMNMGLRSAVIFMLIVLSVVLGLLARFFLNVRKRSKVTVFKG